MRILATILLASAAFVWVSYGLRTAIGALRLPWLRDFAPAPDQACPLISVLVSARNEEENLSKALSTLLALDYPRYEIIAADDRSEDATGRILDEFARTHQRLRVIHVSELPRGWLGKPHGLQQAYEHSSGEWLVFTDADVRFSPDVLRRAVSLAEFRSCDHLTLLGQVEMLGFWEKVIITFFGLGFHLAADPYRSSNPRSRHYIGVGAFQMVRRAAYEASGTHRRLAMEVVDDMKLGKIIKLAGFRSCAAVAPEAVSVRWQAGALNLIRGVTKNFFAGSGFSMGIVAAQMFALLLISVVPFIALAFSHGANFILALVSTVIAMSFQGGVAIVMGASPLYALTHPVGAAIFLFMLLRSTVVTLWQGGIVWRGTFYPLEELRRGQV